MMTDPTQRSPAEWLDDIAESEAQLAAGEVVPAEPVLNRLRETISQLEAKRAGKRPRPAAPRR
jgi:hypothetical protein